ncbi:hypothetical protein BDV18DRAFT_165181 [Aspergillus unguis]
MAEPQLYPPSGDQSSKPGRVLSCVLCQQRKVRCDRSFPCANCVKSKAQCVPAGLIPRPRKRRFPERHLLDRLRQYETLLKENDIAFDPLHPEPQNDADNNDPVIKDSPSRSSSARPGLSEGPYEAKNFWHAMNQASPESDEDGESAAALTEAAVRKAWDQGFEHSDPLFGGLSQDVDFSSLHPEPSQIFRLWQIYLDNVDPLLKVTHTPTLQSRIVEAVASPKSVPPVLQALMFGIYCMATLSLMPGDCQSSFGASREETLAHYQHSCRLALIHARFLRSNDRECLTALFFYLMALRLTVGDPRPMSSLLGIAIRTAQRMGLDNEPSCARHSPLEAELRRRLWWALVHFDSRISEMADHRNTTLSPLWDCKIPSNVSDFDLRPEMRDAPKAQVQPSEALFAIARSEMANYIRNCSFHLDFTCPALKAIARPVVTNSDQDPGGLNTFEKLMEERYLRFCDPNVPLHFMTIWMVRGWLAKARLFEYFSKYATGQHTEAQHNDAISNALAMIDWDTQILSFGPACRYLWLVYFYFPFPAYIHILQHLRRRPLSDRMDECWTLMGHNFETRAKFLTGLSKRPMFQTMTGIFFTAWQATEAALRQAGRPAPTPKVIYVLRELIAGNNQVIGEANPMAPGNMTSQTAPLPTLSTSASLRGSQPPIGVNQYTAPMWMPFDFPDLADDGIFTSSDWSLINWGM